MATITLNTLKAFPTAEGHGKNATGGRGGDVYAVTTLNASGAGSLQDALLTAPVEGRTVIFKVSGWIDHGISDYLFTGQPNITIAGQTSPGGIGIRGELRIQDSNVVVRHLSARNDDAWAGSNKAALRIASYSGQLIENIILDHVSLGWAKDENVTITTACNPCSDNGAAVADITIQNSIIDNNIDTGYNIILYIKTTRVSLYKNLIAYGTERNPGSTSCSTYANGVSLTTFEVINNMIYSFTSSPYSATGTDVDFISNHVDWGGKINQFGDDREVFREYPTTNQFYDQNCVDLGFTTPTSTDWSDFYYTDTLLTENGGSVTPVYDFSGPSVSGVATVSSGIIPTSSTLVKGNIISNAGAYNGLTQGLNTYDSSLLNKIQTDAKGNRLTSRIYPTDFPTLSGGSYPADTIVTGIPDTFSSTHGITSANQIITNWTIGADTIVNNAGYTALEIYLAYIANDFENLAVDTEAPSVTILNVSQIRDDSFLVNLDADEETSLELEYGTATGVYDRIIPPIDTFATTQQYRVGDSIKLTHNTTYYWRIKLEDAAGNIRYTVEQTTTTLEKLPRNNRPHKFGNSRLAAGYVGPIKAIK